MLKQKVHTISTVTFLVVLSLFYLLIFSHKQVLLTLPAIVYLIFVYVVFPSFMIYAMVLKTYHLRWRGTQLKLVIVAYSIVVVILFVQVYLSNNSIIELIAQSLSSGYMRSFHAIWLVIIIALLYAVIFELIRDSGKYNDFINSFKAFPMFSPIFCFGAPVFWEESLLKLGLNQASIKFLSGISFIAGFFFFIALLLFYVSYHLEKNRKPRINVIGDDNLQPNVSETISLYSLLCILLGLAILTFVSFEISYFVLVNSLK